MGVTVQRIDPLSRGDDIKRLFLENDRPEFPEWFDRAYPIAVRHGASSWILVDDSGRIVGHHAAFRASFSLGAREVVGALLSNLMMDPAQRSFFPAAALTKRMVRDLREGGAEFVYSDPFGKGALAVVRAAGLQHICDSNRFILLLGDHRLPLHLAIGMGLRARGLTHRGVRCRSVPSSEVVGWTTTAPCSVSDVSPLRSPDLYVMRWGDLGGEDTLGFAFHGRSGAQVGAALVRLQADPAGQASLITLRCTALDRVPACVAALGLALRSRGVRRLNAQVIQDTPFARAMTRGGFIRRHEPWTVAALGFTDAGKAVAAGMAHSDMEKIDLD